MLPPPKIAAPDPLGSAAPAGVRSSSPAHTHTAIPSASAPDDTVPRLRRCRLARTSSDPCAPPLRAQRNTGGRLPVRPSRWAATDTLAPDCTAEIAAYPFLPHFACAFQVSSHAHTSSRALSKQNQNQNFTANWLRRAVTRNLMT